MSESVVADARFWCVCVFSGFIMAWAYDFVRIFRKALRHKRLWVDIEDILYWTVCFFVSFIVLYYENNGMLRYAAVLAAASGMALYKLSVGRIFVDISLYLYRNTVLRLVAFIKRGINGLRKLKKGVFRRLSGIFVRFHKKILFVKYRLTSFIFKDSI